MATFKINDTTTFPNTTPALTDHFIGTDVSDTANDPDGEVVTFTFQATMDLLEANMSVDLSSFTLTGTKAQFNTALSDGSFQYVLAEGAFVDGDKTKLDAAITSLVADTTPQLGGMLDVNGFSLGDGTLELLKFAETASAVNEVTITNAATTTGPTISATGDDTNIDLNLAAKGTGTVKVGGNTVLDEGSGNVLATFTPAYADNVPGFDASDSDAAKQATVQDYANTHEINAQTGTTYTLVLGDRAKTVTMSNASANTLTIPTNASVAFAVGSVVNVIQLGAGVTSISGATGVTLNGVSAGTGAINTRYQGVSLLKIATDTWVATGDIGTVA